MATRILRAPIPLTSREALTPDTPVFQVDGRVRLPDIAIDTTLFTEPGRRIRIWREIDWGDGVWRSLGAKVFEQGSRNKDGSTGPWLIHTSLRVYPDLASDIPICPTQHRVVVEPVAQRCTIGITCTDVGTRRDPSDPFPPRHRSIALVQEVDNANTVAQVDDTQAFASNVTAGNAITAIASCYNELDLVQPNFDNPTDSLGHTYTDIDLQQTDNLGPTDWIIQQGWYVLNISGGANTVTFSTDDTDSDNFYTVALQEWSGVATSGALDATPQATGTGTAVSAGDIAPTEDNEVKIGFFTHDGGATTTAQEAGWTMLTELDDNNSYQMLNVAYKIDTTAVTEDYDTTLGASRTWYATGFSLKVAAGAGNVAITAALSATGSLSASIAISTPITAALSATGSLAATITVNTPITAALTGTGSLSATIVINTPVAAALIGTGSLSGTLQVSTPVTAALTGTGSLAGTVTVHTPITAALTGTGSLAASLTDDSSVALTGTGSLSASVTVNTPVTATLAGASALSADLAVSVPITAALSGTGSLSATVGPADAAVPSAPAAPVRGLTTFIWESAGAWIPTEPFALQKFRPPVVLLGHVTCKVHPVFEAQAEAIVAPAVMPAARFLTRMEVQVRRLSPVVGLPPIEVQVDYIQMAMVRMLELDTVNGRSGGQRVYDSVEDLVLSGALPPELALLEGLREAFR